MDANSVALLRAQRFAFLIDVYQATGGSTSESVHQRDVMSRLGYDGELADKIGEFLVGEGLLEYHTFGPT